MPNTVAETEEPEKKLILSRLLKLAYLSGFTAVAYFSYAEGSKLFPYWGIEGLTALALALIFALGIMAVCTILSFIISVVIMGLLMVVRFIFDLLKGGTESLIFYEENLNIISSWAYFLSLIIGSYLTAYVVGQVFPSGWFEKYWLSHAGILLLIELVGAIEENIFEKMMEDDFWKEEEED